MATAVKDTSPLTRSWSFDLLPPDMAELRVVLLGNCWIQRKAVGNLLLDKAVFDEQEEPFTTKFSVPWVHKKITVINTPDLLHLDITEDQLTKIIQEFANASVPGPHVFLLVLQPDTFTEQQQQRLQAVLDRFSEHSFDHAMVLILTDTVESQNTFYINNQTMEQMIRKCRYRHLCLKNFKEEEKRQKNFQYSELLARLGQIVKENSGFHLNYEVYEEPAPSLQSAQTHTTQDRGILEKVKTAGLTAEDPTKRHVSGASPALSDFQLRIVLFGKSEDKKERLRKFISEGKQIRKRVQISPKLEHGEWRGKRLTVVKSPDLFSMSVDEVREEMKTCVFNCYPGPNALLLLVKPSEFTEQYRQTLKFILTLFGPNALKHSIVIFTHLEPLNVCANKLLEDCDFRFYQMFEDDHSMLMGGVEAMVVKNCGSFVTFTEGFSEEIKIGMNLVLCGRRGAGKTSAADAILGSTTSSVRGQSGCIKRHKEVHGRWLSIVELPALSGNSSQTVMKLCSDSIFLCDPEGIHAFILVLPVDPLTDEDKAEFKLIQDTLSSQINAFIMVLFTVQSDPTAAAYVDFVKGNKDIQELCQSSGGRYHIFNIKDQQQVPILLDKIESLTMNRNVPQSYTRQMFVQSQIEKITTLQNRLSASETSLLTESEPCRESLRIVLIGKTGSGKSSSGNTILGQQRFHFDISQTSVTKLCQKELSQVAGRRIKVVDTPGLFDSTMSNYEVNEEMLKCINLLAPGPHVFLLVLTIGRFTPEEKETLNLIKKGFGKDADKFTIVLFTRGDELEDFGLSVEEYLKTKCDDSCKKLISNCGNRYHVFNNREKDKARKATQVSDLIKKIDAMVEANGGNCYTNEMLQEAEAAIQKETERLLKEKEEELRKEMQEMEKKHEEQMERIKMRMEKQREEIERERQERDNELKKLELHINQEREKLLDLEVKIKTESKESFDKKLQESRDRMEQDREAWEEERRQWWENRYKEDEKRRREEHARLEKLEKEYKDKMEMDKHKKAEEDCNRREQEEKERRELEERHQKQVEELKRTYEDQARKKAEEFNEFKQRNEIDFSALIQKHLEEVTSLREEIEQGQDDYKNLQKLTSHKETTLKGDMEELRRKHKNQMIDLAVVVLLQKKENCEKIRKVQKQHQEELDKCEKGILEKYKQEENMETQELKEKQLRERKELEKNTEGSDQEQRKREQTAAHEEQARTLKSDMWNQKKQELEKKLGELKKQHEEEFSQITQNLLMQNEKNQAEQIMELEKRQEQELNELMKKTGVKQSDVEVDQLKIKHEKEIDEIKKKMLPEEGRCSIL